MNTHLAIIATAAAAIVLGSASLSLAKESHAGHGSGRSQTSMPLNNSDSTGDGPVFLYDSSCPKVLAAPGQFPVSEVTYCREWAAQ